MQPGVVGPEGGADAAGEPVERDIRQQPVARMGGLDVAVAIRPGAELLHDPGGQAGRAVGQAEGQGLRPGALDPLVAGLLLQPDRGFLEVAGLLRRRVGRRRLVGLQREQVDVDAEQLFRMGDAEAGCGEGAPVAALRAEAPVAQHVRHQRREAIGDRLDAEAWLAGAEGQAVAGQGGRHHGEGIGRVAAEAGGVGEPRNDIEELEDRAGPAMHQQQGHRVGADAGDVQVVQVDPVQRHHELREGIEACLLGAPIEAVLPMGEQALEIVDIGPEGPWLAGCLVGQAGEGEAGLEIGDRRIRDGQGEGARLRGHWVGPPAVRRARPGAGVKPPRRRTRHGAWRSPGAAEAVMRIAVSRVDGAKARPAYARQPRGK